MVNVTITNSSGTTFTFADGEVKSVKSQLNPDIELNPLPGSGPAAAFAFDFNGVVKTISLRGVLFETDTSRTDSGSTTTILEQKQFLEQSLDGFQTSTNFTSNYESQTFNGSSFVQTKVFMGVTDFEEVEGDPERLMFNINLIVGS